MIETTCSQIDGICDMVISGSTVDELLDNRLIHLKQMASLSEEHKRVLDSLQFLSENEIAKWRENIIRKLNKS